MTEAWLDRTKPVRAGEELDAERLAAFLAPRIDGFTPPLTIEQFPGGHSNLTYLLRDAADHEYVLRRPPAGAKGIKAGHDMGREFRILAALRPVFPKVPQAYVNVSEEESPLGVPFYVMERVRGAILRARAPKGITFDEGTLRGLSERFVDQLVALHAVEWRGTTLETLGHPEGYVARQVKGWTERYAKARTDDIPEMERVAEWLAANIPPEAAAMVIHNDFKYDNLVVDPADPTQIRAILDWEMATLGDPVSDLGMALAYWIEAGDREELHALQIGATHLPGNLTRAELVDRYARASGRDVSHIVFFYVLGLFKVGVIAQQIYARYARGLTTDERFGALILAVYLVAQRAAEAIDRGTVAPA